MSRAINRIGRLGILSGLVTAALIVGACTDLEQPHSTLRAAVRQRSAAQILKAGNSRGYEDRILEIEAKVPGFGGLSIDTDGTLKAYLTDTSRAPDARAAVVAMSHAHPELFTRQDGSTPSVHIVKGEYAFSDLVNWEQALVDARSRPAGVRLLDADESLNRIRVGVASTSDEPAILSFAEGLGIAGAAIHFEQVGELYPGTSVQDKLPRRHAGIQIGSTDPTADTAVCTLGFMVHVNSPTGTRGFLTASHCTLNFSGPTGQVWHQNKPANRIGVESNNPAWRTTGCDIGAMYCDSADVAFMTYDDSISVDDSVVQTSTVGTNGSGNTTIGTLYSIAGGKDPAPGDSAYRTGRTSGTTRGVIVGTCVLVPTNGSPTRSLDCQDEVQAFASGGDSGGPVYNFGFPLNLSARYALGIFNTFTAADGQGRYHYYFSPWSLIQRRLGVTLFPF